ncbi:hypothetical protein PFISCL1PPCAC_18824, partial [Pristionchus fissidentatus]
LFCIRSIIVVRSGVGHSACREARIFWRCSRSFLSFPCLFPFPRFHGFFSSPLSFPSSFFSFSFSFPRSPSNLSKLSTSFSGFRCRSFSSAVHCGFSSFLSSFSFSLCFPSSSPDGLRCRSFSSSVQCGSFLSFFSFSKPCFFSISFGGIFNFSSSNGKFLSSGFIS